MSKPKKCAINRAAVFWAKQILSQFGKASFAAAFLLMSVCSVFGQESGAFLKIPVSPAAGGMGDAFTALADDSYGMYYNPAGIAFIKKPVLGVAYHRYVQDISGNSVAFVYPFKNWAIGLAPIVFSMEKEPIYDSFGNKTGDAFAYEGVIAPLSVAAKAGNLAFGVSIKPYREEIYKAAGSARTYDIGAVYQLNKFRFGFASMNLGGKIFGYDLAKTRRFGAAYSEGRYIFSADIKKEGEAGSSVNTGGEFALAEALKLRGGYRFKEDFGGLTFGLGLKLGNFNFDYAFLSYGDLGNTHKAGLSCGFGAGGQKKAEKTEEAKPVEKPAEKAAEQPVVPPVLVRSTETLNVAVADFTGKNVSQADASIVADFLRTELVNTGLYNVMDRNNMDAVLAEQKFQNSGCTEQQCAVEMGKLLNVKQMLVGSLSKLLDTYYVTVNAVDVETGKITASYDSNASSSVELRAACKKIVEQLSRK